MIVTIKWLKRSKWWRLLGFAAILTFGFINLTMVTTTTSVGSLASKQKKVKDRSFVVFLKYQGKALKSFFGLPRVHAAWNGFTREVVPNIKNEVLNHPSHDALLKRLTNFWRFFKETVFWLKIFFRWAANLVRFSCSSRNTCFLESQMKPRKLTAVEENQATFLKPDEIAQWNKSGTSNKRCHLGQLKPRKGSGWTSGTQSKLPVMPIVNTLWTRYTQGTDIASRCQTSLLNDRRRRLSSTQTAR